MVVCKYFQQGYCRYGPSCRFEHVYGSKFNYQANAPSHALSVVTDDQLVNQVQLDAQAVLRGGQWLLSSYAPFKEKGTFPGIPDLSPEEARLFIYEAQASNNFEQAVDYMKSIVIETRYKYEQLLKPSPEIIKVLRSLYNGEVVTSPFVTTQNTSGNSTNNAASVFRNAMQRTPFGENTTPSIFGQQQNDAAKSIFAQASQNIFGSNGQSIQPTKQSSENFTAKSLFAQANQDVFGSNSTPQQKSTSIFGNATQPFFTQHQQQQSSPFANSSNNAFVSPQPNIFGKAKNAFIDTEDDLNIYSKLEDLTEDDIEQFKNDNFKLGFIPELPPPRSLCA